MSAARSRLGAPPQRGLLGPVWELLFPSRCLGCGRRGWLICPACQPGIPWLPAALCPRCARASRDGRVCRRCRAGGSPFLASARAACCFEGLVRRAIHALKFRRARALAPLLAELLAEALQPRPIEADLVIPVPLSPSRQRERGYNQSELIAAELARLVPLPAPSADVLARTRETPPQVGLSAMERRRNLRGAFSCQHPQLVAGRRCLLLDDVMTTGATLEACAEALARAGAARVLGLVVAREV